MHTLTAYRLPLRASLLALCIGLTAPAWAQSPVSEQAKINLRITAQPLDKALTELAAKTGLLVGADSSLLAGKQATALDGSYTPAAALRKLLEGSGLEAVPGSNGSYMLRRLPASSSMLPEVRVTAEQETASSPVNGFVAKRSATGTKTDTPLIETPQSITVIPREQIEAQAADSLDQAFGYSAGIYSLGGGVNRRGSVGFTVRGFNVTGSAPLYLNGSKFPINSLSGTADLYAYERIELLKGPASILYGQAAPGGVINLVSKRPTVTPMREVEFQAGSWNRAQIAADLSGPIGDDGTLGYRITGLTRSADAMVKEIPDDRSAFSGSLVWKPTTQTTLTLLASYDNNKTMYDYGKPFNGTALYNPNGKISRSLFVGEPGFNKFNVEGKTAGYLLEHKFNDNWVARQNLLWFDYTSDYADISISNLTTPASAYRQVTRSAYTRFDMDKGFSIDNQLQGKFSTGAVDHTVLFGLDYVDRTFDRTQRNGTVANLDVYSPVYGSPVTMAAAATNSKTDSSQLGFYVQDHLKIAQRWIVLLGGRWDDAKSNSRNVALNGAVSTSDSKSSAFTYRSGLMYLFDNGVAPYVSYTESFQPQTGTDWFGSPFKPTTGQQYEAGIKFEPRGYNASLTLATYELTQQNVLTRDPDPTHINASVQTGEIRSRGFEIEGRASLAKGFDLTAAYAYTDAEITKSNGVDLGRTPTSVPKNMASVWADYTFRGGDLNGLGLGAGVRYVGETLNNDNSVTVAPFTVVDLALRYQIEKWRLSLSVKNLFDKNYLSACTFACFYGDERNFLLTAKYSW